MSLAVVALLLVASGLTVIEGFPAQTLTVFTRMTDNYLDISVGDTCLKTAMSLSPGLTVSHSQSSALRLSKAINYAAQVLGLTKIKRANVPGTCGTNSAGLNNGINGDEYIYHVGFFTCLLETEWGTPSQADVNVRSNINDKKGVLIFSGCSGNALNRVDLWDGSPAVQQCKYQNCPGSEFDTGCTNVTFYDMP